MIVDIILVFLFIDSDMGMFIVLLVEVIVLVYLIWFEYFVLVMVRVVRFLLCYGYIEDFCFVYSVYGFVLLFWCGDILVVCEFFEMVF